MRSHFNPIFKEWLRKAQEDEQAAKFLLEERVSLGVVCFLSQQVAEKSLKAFLVACHKDIPKIHQIEHLLYLCSKIDENFQAFFEEGVVLTEFYIESRYPGDYPEGISTKEAKKALSTAQKIKKYIENKLL